MEFAIERTKIYNELQQQDRTTHYWLTTTTKYSVLRRPRCAWVLTAQYSETVLLITTKYIYTTTHYGLTTTKYIYTTTHYGLTLLPITSTPIQPLTMDSPHILSTLALSSTIPTPHHVTLTRTLTKTRQLFTYTKNLKKKKRGYSMPCYFTLLSSQLGQDTYYTTKP